MRIPCRRHPRRRPSRDGGGVIRLNRYHPSFEITQEDLQRFFAALARQEAAIQEAQQPHTEDDAYGEQSSDTLTPKGER